MARILSLLAVLFATAAFAVDPPTSADPRLVVELFATAPDIVHPIAMDFDSKGRLLVVESHTHFRPAKYDGPKHDRIRVLEDTDGDGKADKFTTFYEGTDHTMDLAVHFDGSVYLATRNEIIRLRDTDGDGKADEKTRIVHLETAGNYPHNGLSGLAFDSKGNLTFGMGENLGASFKLIGSDGTMIADTEGGKIFHCTADGKKLRRVATGFWNPFGAGYDIFGRLFVVDNDPDSSPPCRLVHVVEGGDYGFQFRYGRAGRHVFQAWNGELPGTLPYVAGTGESPCEVISYESDGLPAEYLGSLLVPAWADHRVERYELKPRGASFGADRKAFIQGGKEFHPSGLSVAPDGSVFVSDWGSRSYELHGKGAVWHVRQKDAKPAKRPADPKEAILSMDRKMRENAARELVKTEEGSAYLRSQLMGKDVRVRASALNALVDAEDKKTIFFDLVAKDTEVGISAMAMRGIEGGRMTYPAPALVASHGFPGSTDRHSVIRDAMPSPDAFLVHSVVRCLSFEPFDALSGYDLNTFKDPKERIGILLAWRVSGHKNATRILDTFLKDPDPDVRFMAVKWVSDEKLVQFRPQIVGMLKDPKLDPRGFIALATALARLDDKPVNDDGLADYFLGKLFDKSAPLAMRLMAVQSISATSNKLKTEQLTALLAEDTALLTIEALRSLKDRGDAKAAPSVLALARDAKQPVGVRAQAILTLSALGSSDATLLRELAAGENEDLAQEAKRALPDRVLAKTKRPAATDTDAWLKLLEGPADTAAGRRIFENNKLTNCSSCHRVEGRGANVGPDLSLIGRTDRKWIVESILQPSAVVAPHFQTWKVETTDGKTFTGLLVHTNLDESFYLNEKGLRVKVLATDVSEITPLKTSIMPDGLLDALTDREIRDLVAYLAARK